MQKEIIKEALKEAEYLLSNEFQSLLDENLISEYNNVLQKIAKALAELEINN